MSRVLFTAGLALGVATTGTGVAAAAPAVHHSRVLATSGAGGTGHPVKVWVHGSWQPLFPGHARTTDEVTADYPFFVDTPATGSAVCYRAGAPAWVRGDSFAWTVAGC